MTNNTVRKQQGLTLVEVLIVVVLMGIIAAVAIPRFSTTTQEALENTLDANLASMRNAIELYAAQHAGRYPGQFKETDGATLVANDAEAAAAFIAQLTQYSNINGKTSTSKDAANFPYGPYFREGIPKASLPTESNTVTADFDEVNDIANSLTADGTGWKVAVQTGQIIVNDKDYDHR
jgi:prepilin-type N-terminal cleavage/methylation domain-containing protein